MAYQGKNLGVMSHSNGFTFWHYVTEDSLAEVSSVGYFDGAEDLIRVGDLFVANVTGGQTVLFTATGVNPVAVAGISGFSSPPDVEAKQPSILADPGYRLLAATLDQSELIGVGRLEMLEAENKAWREAATTGMELEVSVNEVTPDILRRRLGQFIALLANKDKEIQGNAK